MLEIRPAGPEDVKSIASLYVCNHRTTYKNLLPAEYFETLTDAYAENKWQKYIADNNNCVWVAEDEGVFLGFVASTLDDELPGVWYLDSLHVCESARGKGVGTALIKTVGKYALDNGYKKMSICIVKVTTMQVTFTVSLAQVTTRILRANYLIRKSFCGMI